MEMSDRRSQARAQRKFQLHAETHGNAAVQTGSGDVPLAVDLDGTLIYTDLLWESILALLKENIFSLFLLPAWLARGKAHLKQEIARRVSLDPTILPYNRDFLTFLRQEYRRGRVLILTTASDRVFADQIAGYLGIFADVLASDGKQNLKGANKAKVLREKFGDGGFEYAGNEAADLQIWANGRGAIVVNAPARLIEEAKKIAPINRVFETRRKPITLAARVLRPKHWVKNALIFVPLITSQEFTDLDLVFKALCAFLAFSLLASSVYVLNDLADLNNDRRHHEKSQRPFASGEVSLLSGIIAIPVLLMASAAVSLAFLSSDVLLLLGGYFVLNIGYSFYFKQVPLVDVLFLAMFYSWRVVAGGAATHIVPSSWLLVFSAFIFLSLSFAKRVSELQSLRDSNKEKTTGRGYRSTDLEQLASFGAASGYIAVLVFALYVSSPGVKQLYRSTETLWIVCPLLLYWVSRLWLLVHRRQMPEDPVVFVCKDKVSYAVGLAVAVTLMIAN